MRPFALVIAAVLVALASSQAHAQARVSAEVDRARVTVGDDLRFSIDLAGNFDALELPSLTDFAVGGPVLQEITINGVHRSSRVYTLRPKKPGTFTIGPTRLKLAGKVVAESAPIQVTVDPGKTLAPVSGEEAQDLAKLAESAAFMRWGVPRTHFYVGEPFPLTLELWLRTGLSVRQAEMVQTAKLDGLLVEDLPRDQNPDVARRMIGDLSFDTLAINSALATPLKPGRLLIDAATVRAAVAQDQFGFDTKRVALTAQPFYLDIRDVPTAGRPAAYHPGNVGQWKLTGSLRDGKGQSPTRAHTGERMVLRAVIEGSGNLQSLAPPSLSKAEAWEASILPSTAEDAIKKDASGMSGRRVFQWLITPKSPGNLRTPTIDLAWWDPVAERFQEAHAGGAPIDVTGEAIATQFQSASALGEDVGPIFETASLTGGSDRPLGESPLYWAVLALPLAAFAALDLRARRRARDQRHPFGRLAREASTNARKRLRAAEQALKDGLVKDFYGQLARTLASYLEEKANIPATGLTHAQVRATARHAGYPDAMVEQLVIEMENCDFARFAPSGAAADKMREAHGRIAALIAQLDHVEPTRRP